MVSELRLILLFALKHIITDTNELPPKYVQTWFSSYCSNGNDYRQTVFLFRINIGLQLQSGVWIWIYSDYSYSRAYYSKSQLFIGKLIFISKTTIFALEN